MLKLRHVTDELERLRRYIDGMEERGTAAHLKALKDKYLGRLLADTFAQSTPAADTYSRLL